MEAARLSISRFSDDSLLSVEDEAPMMRCEKRREDRNNSNGGFRGLFINE